MPLDQHAKNDLITVGYKYMGNAFPFGFRDYGGEFKKIEEQPTRIDRYFFIARFDDESVVEIVCDFHVDFLFCLRK